MYLEITEKDSVPPLQCPLAAFVPSSVYLSGYLCQTPTLSFGSMGFMHLCTITGTEARPSDIDPDTSIPLMTLPTGENNQRSCDSNSTLFFSFLACQISFLSIYMKHEYSTAIGYRLYLCFGLWAISIME